MLDLTLIRFHPYSEIVVFSVGAGLVILANRDDDHAMASELKSVNSLTTAE